MLDGKLYNKVITNIINFLFEQYQIIGKVSYIRYLEVNKKSVSQDKDNFDRMNISDDQITILIPFTDLSFPSCLYNQSIYAEEHTRKICLFLEDTEEIIALESSARTTRD